MPELTDTSVFEPIYYCSNCQSLSDECDCNNYTPVEADTSFFLKRAADAKDIHLLRLDDGSALVDIDQELVYHSNGFEWGYNGSGPSDLALNILALFVPTREAWKLHNDYTWDVIAQLDREENHTITTGSVSAWILKQWSKTQKGMIEDD